MTSLSQRAAEGGVRVSRMLHEDH